MALKTPLGWAAERWALTPRALRWASTAALLWSIVIIFTGGLVRITGSGLGCTDWPTCDGTNIFAVPEMGIHGFIEFGNRLLTGVIILAVAWVIIAARLQRPRVRSLTRLAWSQFWLVVANALAGGVSVLAKLNPWVVALHFVLAIALLATTTLTWHRVHENRAVAPTAPSGRARGLSWALAATSLLLVVAGTLVTGSGPHAGDSADVPRMGFDWATVTWVHGVLAVVVAVLAVALLVVVTGSAERERLVRRRLVVFLIVFAAQGLAGLVQALTGLPEALVSFHLLGAALVWVGALRVLLDVNPLLFARVGFRDASAAGALPDKAAASL